VNPGVSILGDQADHPASAFRDLHSLRPALSDGGSHDALVQFSDSAQEWQPVPSWADFLVRFGSDWISSEPHNRRISVISMPCESAAAGLVVLGVMRRRLAVEDANDCAAHYARIEQLAAHHRPESFLRHKDYKGRFFVESKVGDGIIRVAREDNDNSRVSSKTKFKATIILHSKASDWNFEGEAPVETTEGAELPNRRIYETLLTDPAVLKGNLKRSDSWVCLAGRVAGESVSRNIFATIRFKYVDDVADLAQLLTIQDWSPRNVSRVNFFNTRIARLDRNTGLTKLVVADGDASFLKVLEAPEFKSSDVIGVIHRAVARESLEAIGVKLSSLTQWYTPDDIQGLRPPIGITVSTLRRKA
jgi:hypothetical protein